MREKICIVTSVHRHDDVRIYHKEARCLAQEGYRVVLLSPDGSGEDEIGVVFQPLPLPKDRRNRMLVASRIALPLALKEEADLYHLHDPELLPLALALKRQGKRVIYDAHEDLPLQLRDKRWLPGPARPITAGLAGGFLHWACQRLDAVVGATPEIAAQLPHGVSFCNYPAAADLSEEAYAALPPYGERALQAAYVGAITEGRGIFSMLEAARLAGIRLVMAGSWEDQELIVQAHRSPGWPFADWRGSLPHGAIYPLLGQCRMGLLLLSPTAAYRRSYPIKLFEYLLAGLPVVASDFELWRKLAGECALYVPPDRPAEAAKAIRWLLAHPQEARAMGEAGRKRVLERHSLEREQERLLALYRAILSREERRP